MRVIAGSARRLLLETVSGMETRPTTDRIKETLFNMLNMQLMGSRFLDLFAGSGAIGIEALSRGASFACFVENNREAASCVKRNLLHTKLNSSAKVMEQDVLSALSILEGEEGFDLIFMDPPYGQELEKNVLLYLAGSELVHESTTIIVESDLNTKFDYLSDTRLVPFKEKRYKTNMHTFFAVEEKKL